jgi:hypothetical protein
MCKGAFMDEIFNQFQQRYQQLRAMREAGQLSLQQFVAELQNMRWQDANQFWWAINPEGVFLCYDGQQWVPAQPPQPAPLPSDNVPPVSIRPAPVAAKSPTGGAGRSWRTFAPILMVILSLGFGGLWFLYTLIGAYKAGNIWGIDWITPLIVGGLPFLLWVSRKPIDKLLLPLKPILQRIPKPLRLGTALVVPLLLSCGCSTLAARGYSALSVSTFVSVMFAAVLLRF